MDFNFEVLHSPFDIETHKKTFINYLEIMIDEDGVCHYAVPSHQGFLEEKVMAKNNIQSLQEYVSFCDRPECYDYWPWMMKEIGQNYVAVWRKFVHMVKPMNDKQRATLEKLKEEGLYQGEIL